MNPEQPYEFFNLMQNKMGFFKQGHFLGFAGAKN